MASQSELLHAALERLSSGSPPQLAEFYTSDRCSLRCSHCFHGDSRSLTLPAAAWKTICSDLYDWGTRRFSVGGREPFATETTLDVARFLVENYSDITLGAVCDGFTWLQLKSDPRLSSFHYLEFSVDGDQKIHDQIRGEGAFAKTMAGLDAAPEAFPNATLSIAMAVGTSNSSRIRAVWDLANRLHMPRLFLQPVEVAGFAQPQQCLTPSHLPSLLEAIFDLAASGQTGSVLLFVPHYFDEVVERFLASSHAEFARTWNTSNASLLWFPLGAVRVGFMRERVRIPFDTHLIIGPSGHLLPHFSLKVRASQGALPMPSAAQDGVKDALIKARASVHQILSDHLANPSPPSCNNLLFF